MLKYILISFLFITNVYAYTCEEMGYTKSIADCPEGGLKCPAQPEKMFCCDPCGDGRGYRYNKNNCSPNDGLQLAGIECGGKWTECRSCTSEYKYNHDNCRSPKVLAGVQCGNAYTGCVYPSGIGCVPTVGYIYYSDGSCHAEYDDIKTPIGIIVDAARKIIISLDEEKLPWNDGTRDFLTLPLSIKYNLEDAPQDFNGSANTDTIIAFAQSVGREYKAAQYCANKITGNKKWYLPALGELIVLYQNKTEVQNGLDRIVGSIKLSDSSYRSSTSTGYRASYTVSMSKGWAGGYPNNDGAYPIRCMFQF